MPPSVTPSTPANAASTTPPLGLGCVGASRLIASVARSTAARHAEAKRVDVRVAVAGTTADGHVLVTVEDDGRGFAGHTRESGLRNLRERAATVGGTCAVESTPGIGTVVRWQAPLTLPDIR